MKLYQVTGAWHRLWCPLGAKKVNLEIVPLLKLHHVFYNLLQKTETYLYLYEAEERVRNINNQ